MRKLTFLFIVLNTVFAINATQINPLLQQTFTEKEIANIFISFKGSNSAVLKSIQDGAFSTRTEKLNSLKNALQNQAAILQTNIQNYLKENEIEFKEFWITNQLYIKGANKDLVHYLASHYKGEIESIDEEQIIPNITPNHSAVKNLNYSFPGWGVERIQASEAWAIANGSGIVVANIDNGVFTEHEDLSGRYRPDHGWLAPNYVQPAPIPFDETGTGTATIGVILSVAPAAEWIACRACGVFDCYQSWILSCGEWSLCPTEVDGSNPDCSKAPNIVTADWGARAGYAFFEPVVDAMVAGGIVPVFPIGDFGVFGCGYVLNPGAFNNSIGVGFTNFVDLISGISGTGPTNDGRIKPDLSAPGEEIVTTWHRPEEKYVEISSSFIGAAHTAGVTALLKSIDPNMSFEEVRQTLIEGVETNLRTRDGTCGDIPDTQFPNNYYGYGRINALNSVQLAKTRLESKGQ